MSRVALSERGKRLLMDVMTRVRVYVGVLAVVLAVTGFVVVDATIGALATLLASALGAYTSISTIMAAKNQHHV